MNVAALLTAAFTMLAAHPQKPPAPRMGIPKGEVPSGVSTSPHGPPMCGPGTKGKPCE